MNCKCCCINTLDFCDQDVCTEIDFDITAQATGTHTLTTDFLGRKITITKAFDAGDKIIFPVDGLNENFQYTAQLYDPTGTQILIRKNDVDYDCFKFKTVINATIAA